MRMTTIAALLTLLLAACVARESDAQTVGRRRAMLVGINDYSAARLGPRTQAHPPAGRDWPDLRGAVNDVASMQEMLVARHGFDRRDIATLLDHQATRAAILQTLERHLVQPASAGDVILFYFAGHGSQVANSRSDEPDQLDETLVPADSRRGARDVRDKELRRIFNRILDRGAQLTVILDHCYSGSGARGLPSGARPRGIAPDLRDLADGSDAGPRPETRGALVISSARDHQVAWEDRDDDTGQLHGAFSWAWIRAMREASPGEPASETFLRAYAKLRVERADQDPVIAGTPAAQRRPFLGTQLARGEPLTIAVEQQDPNGSVRIAGGWAHGLSVGSVLRPRGDAKTRLEVTTLVGLTRSEARVRSGAVRSGTLLELVGWSASPPPPLRVWMPPGITTTATAQAMARAAERRRIRWVADPTDVSPTHVLRRGPRGWELLRPTGATRIVGSDANAIATIAQLPRRATLFVQLPLTLGVRTAGVTITDRPEDADYLLGGRYANGRTEYAWLRPYAHRNGLPARSAWTRDEGILRDALVDLRRIHAWHRLESPPQTQPTYRLGIRRGSTFVADGPLVGDETCELVLRAPAAPRVPPRHFYAFTIDSHGRSILLHPRSGSVENYFPLPNEQRPRDVALAKFAVAPPYGIDTYFLLSTDEPLTNPSILEWDGVRGSVDARTPLERLLMLTITARSARVLTPSSWSLERVVLESVPAPRRGGGR